MRLFKDVRHAKRLLKDVTTYDGYLIPGKWRTLFKHPSLVVLCHSDVVRLPDSLASTLNRLWRKKPNSLFGYAYRLFFDVVVPSQIEVEGQKTSQEVKASIVVIRRSGKSILFDIEKRIVYKHFPRHVEWASYRHLREEIKRAYQIAEQVWGGEHYLWESLETGEYFGNLDFRRRVRVVKRLSYGAAALCSSRGFGSSLELISLGFDLASRSIRSASLRRHIASRRTALIRAASCWPLIPAHRDLTAHNMVIRGDTPVLLDVSPSKIGLAPVFFDCLCLFLSEAVEYGRFDLLRAFVNGEMDHVIDPLWNGDKVHRSAVSRVDVLLAEALCMASMNIKIGGAEIESWYAPVLQLSSEKREGKPLTSCNSLILRV